MIGEATGAGGCSLEASPAGGSKEAGSAGALLGGVGGASAPVLASVFCLIAGGCGPRAADVPTGWQGTVTTEGAVTIVRNTAGSVWDGTVTLVEEASIGVAAGADAYMLGNPTGVWATDDRIYVVDAQIPIVRAYDFQGRFLHDVGRGGQGPGEYRGPSLAGVTPSGRVVVTSYRNAMVNVYGADGSLEESWRVEPPFRALGAIVASNGDLMIQRIGDGMTPGDTRWGLQGIDARGPIGEPTFPPDLGFEPWFVEALQIGADNTVRLHIIPFAPVEMSTFAPSGLWIVGVNETYRFEVVAPDGSSIIVERFWDPVPVHPDESAYRKRAVIDTVRMRQPSWTWNGPDVPAYKPAYNKLLADHSDRVWVIREGPSERVDDCTESFTDGSLVTGSATLCWQPSDYWWDAFDIEGKYLGELEVPDGVGPDTPTFIRDDVFVTVVEDEDGTAMVKRYRLVLPGDGS